MTTSTLRYGLLILAFGLPLAGCTNHEQTSSIPQTPLTPTATGVSAAAVVPVIGYIADTAFHPGAGALIEVLDGPDAGMSTKAGPAGDFTLSGRFTNATLFRASWDGHVTTVGTLYPCPTCRPNQFLFFRLSVPAPPVPLAGEYSMTFVADASCSGIPEELRTRTYRVRVNPDPTITGPPGTSFVATAIDHSFLASSRSFSIGVAGDLVGFLLEVEEGPVLVEDLGAGAYLGFVGRAEAAVGSAMTSVSTPFRGEIDYCVQKTKMGEYWSCIGQQATHAECTSNNHRLIVTSP